MTDPPFDVALRLNVEAARSPIRLDDLKQPGWRDQLVPIISRELGSRHFPSNVVPTKEDASQALAKTFADHPMVNVSVRAKDGQVQRGGPMPEPQAFVIGEVVLRPELASIQPGGEYPDVGDEVVTEYPFVVHASPWPHTPGSEEECSAAEALLQRVISALPGELWLQDD